MDLIGFDWLGGGSDGNTNFSFLNGITICKRDWRSRQANGGGGGGFPA